MVSVHHGMWADCMLTRVVPVVVMCRACACMLIDGHVHITATMWPSLTRPYAQSGPVAGAYAKHVGHPKRARHAASALQMPSRCSRDQLALACVPSHHAMLPARCSARSIRHEAHIGRGGATTTSGRRGRAAAAPATTAAAAVAAATAVAVAAATAAAVAAATAVPAPPTAARGERMNRVQRT